MVRNKVKIKIIELWLGLEFCVRVSVTVIVGTH